MKYTTQYILNLSTGAPFEFEVSKEKLTRFNKQKKMIERGEAPMLGTVKKLTEIFELSLFPAFERIIKIFFENEYSEELIIEILTDFGLPEDFIMKFLEDPDCTDSIRPWFEGITCDGERAARTLLIVYKKAKEHYSL